MNALFKLPSVILTSCLVLSLHGCCSDGRNVSTGPASVAKRYAQERFGFKNPQVENVGLFIEDYSIMVWDEPQKPGGFVIIHVSKDNKVIGWDPGR
jgi:hypothetical protein